MSNLSALGLASVYDLLTGFAHRDDFWGLFETAFGTQYDRGVAEGFRLQWLAGEFGQSPQVEVVSETVLGTANGAYAVSTNTIYLSDQFVATASRESLEAVLLEEFGHFVDARVNSSDSAGDEGAIFAALVLGESLDANTLQALKAEDDHATITVNGQSVLVEQQNFTGTNGNETITGTAGDDTINPRRGNDSVNGGAGNDLLIVNYSGNTSGIYSSLSPSGTGGFNGYFSTNDGADQVNYSNIERFQVTGTSADDNIIIGSGDDTVNGGGGVDFLTDDFSASSLNLTFNFAGATPVTPTGTSITNIERFNLTTGSGNDSITLKGIYDDTLITGAGDDTINPGRGYDSVDGGTGNDLLVVDYSGNTSGINSSLSLVGTGGFNGYFYTNDGSDQVDFNNIERFQITGTSADDNIIIGSGNDTVNGGGGVDFLTDDFSASTSNLTFNFTGTTPVTPTGTSITNIERFNLTTGSGNDSITLAGIYDDTLTTGAGDDTINPGRGYDSVDGGTGNDLLIVDYSGNTSGIDSSLSPAGTGGFNGYFYTNDGSDQVDFNNIERFQITGTSADDSIYTGSGNDSVTGGAGNDSIYAGSGDDNVNGGDGTDVLTDDFSASTSNLTFNFAGTTPITPTGTSISNIEKFNLTTGSGNDSITLKGIYDDTLTSGAGDDTINPGRGYDSVDGGTGNDLLIVDYSGNTSGIYSSLSPAGTGGFNGYFYTNNGSDQVDFNNIERFQITGTSADDSIYTGSGNDSVVGGTGNDSIDGGSGNDIIIGVNPNSIAPGKREIDSLTGGAGSDKFILGDATWIGYDDTNTTSAGNSNYALITDFNPTEDTIQLRSPSSNYLLVVTGTDTRLYIDKTGEPDELIAVLQNRTGLSLTGSYFNYDSSSTLPSITLAVSPASVTEDGTANLVYTFTRTGATTNTLTVNYGITGTADSTDYTGATPGTGKTITFAAGSSTATLTIDPTADTTIEPDETVALTLASGTGYTIVTTTAVNGTIINDDFPIITLAVAPTSVTEDGTTNLVYTFTRTGAITSALTVNYSITGTADNIDYTGATPETEKTITFAEGSSTATLTIDPKADTTVEANETVALTLATGTGYTIGTATPVIGTILDDEPGKITGLKWNDLNGNGIREDLIQGNPPDIIFVIDVSGSTSDPFQGLAVGDVNNDGTANTRLDAELAGFIALNNRLVQKGLGNTAKVSIVTFESIANQLDMNPALSGLQLATNAAIDSNNNNIKDVEEILRSLIAGGGTNFAIALQNATSTLTALGTTPGNGNVIFISDGEVNEGGTYNNEVLSLRNAGVKLSAFGVGQNASLSNLQIIDPNATIFTSTDQLLAVFDGLGSGTQSFKEPGLAGVTLYLDLNNNGVLDTNEPTQITTTDNPSTPNIDEAGQYSFNNVAPGTYIVREVIPTGYSQTFPNNPAFHTVIVGSGQTVNNINFGNTTPPAITLAVTPSSVNEDGTANLIYTFTRAGNLTNALTVNYTVGGTAIFSSDYTQTGAETFTATTGTITFAAGLSTATLTIDPTADTTIEPDETVALTLAAGTGYTIGTTTAVTGTILNDEPLTTLSLNDITVIEGKDANAVLTVSLSSPSSQPITVNYSTSPVNATANSDYTTTTGTITIPANANTGTITIPLLNDNLNEPDEAFIVTLSNPINATLSPDPVGEVIITDTWQSTLTRTLPANVENLKLIGNNAINGTGNARNNVLTGNSANNILNGGGGNDILNGGAGIDSLLGGLGNDSYQIDSTTDTLTELSGQGTDTVQSSVTFSLAALADIENLTLTGSSTLNGTGNLGNNVLTGNSANNTLSGDAGNDTLTGAGGKDTLTGGAGNDQFLFRSGAAFTTTSFGVDIITDFLKGTDKIALSKASFTALTSAVGGNLQATEFAIINTAANEQSLAGSSSAKLIYNSATGNLFYNPDSAIAGFGNGGLFATVNGSVSLDATDFWVQA